MEHRSGQRLTLNLPTSLSQGNVNLGWFTCKNIGSGGIALKGKIAGLKRDSIVNLSIELLLEGKQRIHHCKALVIHQSGGCIGLMWVEESSRLLMQKLVASLTPLAA